ncbi:adenylate kinase [Acidothermaceae bacterium B102]|nr:adenylate kinase [Acidothermaceae bacterium B102]
MRIVIFGPPGSGKGTQAVRIAAHYGGVHISTGDILRAEIAAGTELGHQVQGYLDNGDLVPDELVTDIAWPRILEAALGPGYVLDGFPRTVGQAEAAYARATAAGVTADTAVYLDAAAEPLVARLLARAQVEGRADDTAEVIANRLAVFAKETEPLVDYYEQRGLLVHIDGLRTPDEVTQAIIAALDAR